MIEIELPEKASPASPQWDFGEAIREEYGGISGEFKGGIAWKSGSPRRPAYPNFHVSRDGWRET